MKGAAVAQQRRILVVDDSRVVRRVARRILEQAGLIVDEACNGADALKHVHQECPDAMLLDWNMPIMNGIDCLRALRQEFGQDKPCIILCSTENNLDSIIIAIEAGAQEYIMKPFDDMILLGKLDQLGLLDRAI
jgi:two-component system chemotaxis response regulator CheY